MQYSRHILFCTAIYIYEKTLSILKQSMVRTINNYSRRTFKFVVFFFFLLQKFKNQILVQNILLFAIFVNYLSVQNSFFVLWHNDTRYFHIPVGDPGFPRGGGANPRGGERQPIIWSIFPANCMKMKKFWAGGDVPLAPLRSATVFISPSILKFSTGPRLEMCLFSGLNQCLENSIRWCTVGNAETRKCRAMKEAFAGASLSRVISCYQAEDHVDCMGLIRGMISYHMIFQIFSYSLM